MSRVPYSTKKKFFQIVQNNEITALKELLVGLQEMGLNWSDCMKEKSGETLLHVSARAGRITILRMLCEEWAYPGLSLEVSDINGKKCLHEAAQSSQAAIVDYLLNKGAKVDALKSGDWTPLMFAVTKSGPKAVKTVDVLLRHAADIQLTNKDGWTALHIAARKGDVDVISLLLSHGADVTAVSDNGRTVLHIAAFHGQLRAVELFLAQEDAPLMKTDSCGFTPLLEAVRGGWIQVIQLLLKAGADVAARDKMGLSSIHIAAQMGHIGVIYYLVKECNVNPNLSSWNERRSPLHCAARTSNFEAAETLLMLGADPKLEDSRMRTASDSAFGPNAERIRRLIDSYR